jgi:16S rRNA (cytosine967-C5)-methyltransferase
LNNRQLISLVHHFLQLWSQDTTQTSASILEPILISQAREDRPKMTATVSGILRHWLLLQHVIGRYSRIKAHKIHPHLTHLLTIATYQLLFDTTIPDHAVLHAAVSNCITHQKGFANGLLRTISRNRDTLLKDIIPGLPLPIRSSFPQAYIDHLSAAFPGHSTADLLDYLNTEPVFHTLAADSQLLAEGKGESDLMGAFARRLVQPPGTQPVHETDLQRHQTWIQNVSSQFISYFAVMLRPRTILDLCAAPGSKSSLIALLDPDIHLVAHDLSRFRLGRLKQRMAANPGLFPGLSLCCGNAEQITFQEGFDLLILDAPCSALGTVRKHPDRRYDCGETRIRDLANRQFSMLHHGLTHHPQTPLLYSVCTFTEPETQGVLNRLHETGAGEATSWQRGREKLLEALKQSDLPHQATSDGAFILPDRQRNTDLFFVAMAWPERKI